MRPGERTFQDSEPSAVAPRECERFCSFADQDTESNLVVPHRPLFAVPATIPRHYAEPPDSGTFSNSPPTILDSRLLVF